MRTRIGFTLLSSLVVLSGCSPKPDEVVPEEVQEPTPPVEISFPISRPLVDAEGRAIEAHMTGRSETHVRFYIQGTSEEETFDYPIKDLSIEDQAFLAKTPTTFTQSLEGEGFPQTQEGMQALRLRNLETDIARLEERIAEERKRLTPGMPSFQRKGIKNDLDRRIAELKNLERRKKELLEESK